MKKYFQTIINIWSIKDLRDKILYTLALVFIYRVGTHVVIPGIATNSPAFLPGHKDAEGLLGLFNTFAGGAFSNASILALGIMPYISASIFMQLTTILIPQMQKLQKEGDSGRKKINQWTRYLTIIVTAFQGAAYVTYLKNLASKGDYVIYSNFEPYFWVSTIIVLIAGTLFVMWLAERIQDNGLGNGTSIIITVGILARLPQAFIQEFQAKINKNGGGMIIFIVEIAILIVIVLALIMLIQGVRKLMLNYAKQLVGGASRQPLNSARQYLPIKINAAGVMPIIFAQAIMFLPTLVSFTKIESGQGIARMFSDHSNMGYMIVYSILVIGFTFLYTALIFNPRQVAEELKRNNGFIPGVKPGEDTANFIGMIMDRITLPGAVFLAIIGILPGIASRFGVTSSFSTFFGGTSLLIMVGVVLDTLQQIETQLLMHKYDGLMSAGKIQGRN